MKAQQILNKLEDRKIIHFQLNQNLEDQDNPSSTDQYLIDFFKNTQKSFYVVLG